MKKIEDLLFWLGPVVMFFFFIQAVIDYFLSEFNITRIDYLRFNVYYGGVILILTILYKLVKWSRKNINVSFKNN